MADRPPLSPPPAEQRRIAADNFDRARQVIVTGNHDYAIQLLTTCCKIDPANVLYRQALRRAQKEKYDNDLRGSRFAFLSTPRWKARMKAAKAKGDYLRVLEHGEAVLTRNPWDLTAQMDMADAFDNLGLTDLAVFTLDQARQKYPKDATLNRALARMFEKRGDFQKAIALWVLVKEHNPSDVEATHKANSLAASETIQRGGYESVAAGKEASPAKGGRSGSDTHSALPAKTGSGSKSNPAIRTPAEPDQPVDRLSRDVTPIQKRIEADPTEPTLYVQLAGIYRRHGEDDRARACLQQGLGPTGNHFSLQIELQDLDLLPFRRNLETADAKIAAKKAKPADDEDDDDGPSLAELQAVRAKLSKEILSREADLFRMKAERFPNDVSHKLELGTRLLHLDRVDEAIAELQQARRDEKLKGKAAMYLGVCFRKRNNWRLASRNFEEALQALPKGDDRVRKEALYHLATGSADNGDLPRAIDVGHELANLDFGFRNIGKLLDEWEHKAQKV